MSHSTSLLAEEYLYIVSKYLVFYASEEDPRVVKQVIEDRCSGNKRNNDQSVHEIPLMKIRS